MNHSRLLCRRTDKAIASVRLVRISPTDDERDKRYTLVPDEPWIRELYALTLSRTPKVEGRSGAKVEWPTGISVQAAARVG